MNHTASSHRPAISATMTPMTTPRVLAATLAGAALALTGCSLTAPSAEPATSAAPPEASPTTCEVNYNGPPDAPSWLHVDCGDTHWSMPGPWTDRQSQYLDEGAQARDGLKLTKAIVVGGDARAWISTETLSCVATRDLLDTAAETRVRCHDPEPEPEPTEKATTPPPAASPSA